MSERIIKQCPSYYGYLASNDGFIYSARIGYGRIGVDFNALKQLKAQIHKGYQVVTVPTQKGRRPIGVQFLVADAFIGPKPPSAQLLRHLDDNRLNNRSSNLAYGTYLDNAADMTRNGKRLTGCMGPRSKLSMNALVEIRSHVNSNERRDALYKRLGRVYGVSQWTIRAAMKGYRYINEVC
jgi:hypothetical protein